MRSRKRRHEPRSLATRGLERSGIKIDQEASKLEITATSENENDSDEIKY